jgi:HK97 family phage major capsid protein
MTKFMREAPGRLFQDPDSMSKQTRGQAIEVRRQWLKNALDWGGDNGAGLSDSELRDVGRVSDELESLMDGFDGSTKHPGFPGSGGGRGGGRVPAQKGWQAGYWSDPFTKGLGRKDLTPSGSVTVPSLTGGIVPIEDRPQRLLDAIPVEPLTGTDTFAFLRETARVHAAAETAPQTAKPVSTYSVQKIEDTVKVIAHLSEPIDRFALEDARLLNGYIDGSMRQGVMLRLDGQILNGDGTGQDLLGLAATPGIQVQPFDTDVLTSLRKALTRLQAIEVPGGSYVLSPAMWEGLELAAGTNQDYALNNGGANRLPVDTARKRVWGQSVVVSSALSGDLAFLVDFQGSTRLWERDGVRVDWSEAAVGSVAGQAGFTSNELTFRAEGRWGFGVTRPTGVVSIDTTGV